MTTILIIISAIWIFIVFIALLLFIISNSINEESNTKISKWWIKYISKYLDSTDSNV